MLAREVRRLADFYLQKGRVRRKVQRATHLHFVFQELLEPPLREDPEDAMARPKRIPDASLLCTDFREHRSTPQHLPELLSKYALGIPDHPFPGQAPGFVVGLSRNNRMNRPPGIQGDLAWKKPPEGLQDFCRERFPKDPGGAALGAGFSAQFAVAARTLGLQADAQKGAPTARAAKGSLAARTPGALAVPAGHPVHEGASRRKNCREFLRDTGGRLPAPRTQESHTHDARLRPAGGIRREQKVRKAQPVPRHAEIAGPQERERHEVQFRKRRMIGRVGGFHDAEGAKPRKPQEEALLCGGINAWLSGERTPPGLPLLPERELRVVEDGKAVPRVQRLQDLDRRAEKKDLPLPGRWNLGNGLHGESHATRGRGPGKALSPAGHQEALPQEPGGSLVKTGLPELRPQLASRHARRKPAPEIQKSGILRRRPAFPLHIPQLPLQGRHRAPKDFSRKQPAAFRQMIQELRPHGRKETAREDRKDFARRFRGEHPFTRNDGQLVPSSEGHEHEVARPEPLGTKVDRF